MMISRIAASIAGSVSNGWYLARRDSTCSHARSTRLVCTLLGVEADTTPEYPGAALTSVEVVAGVCKLAILSEMAGVTPTLMVSSQIFHLDLAFEVAAVKLASFHAYGGGPVMFIPDPVLKHVMAIIFKHGLIRADI